MEKRLFIIFLVPMALYSYFYFDDLFIKSVLMFCIGFVVCDFVGTVDKINKIKKG